MRIKTVCKNALGYKAKFVTIVFFMALFMIGIGLNANASVSTKPMPSPRPNSFFIDAGMLGHADSVGMKISGLPTARPVSLGTLGVYPKYLLKPVDVALYKNIFARVEKGDLKTAKRELAQVSDKRLVGYIEHNKLMHPTAHRSTYAELRDWLKSYSDHTGAEDIYDLAESRRPENYKAPKRPSIKQGTRGGLDHTSGSSVETYSSPRSRTTAQKSKIYLVRKELQRYLASDQPEQAWSFLNTIENENLLDTVEFDDLRADLAQNYYLSGDYDRALVHAQAASNRSGADVPLAGWIAGLTEWRRENYKAAATHLETVAQTRRATPWMVTAGAYWSARSYAQIGEKSDKKRMLKIAAAYPYTFYGLIANKALKVRSLKFDGQAPEFSDSHFETLSQSKIGKRAIGLIQVGQEKIAENELMQMNVSRDPRMKNALLAIASEWNMSALALQLGSGVKNEEGGLLDAALYPELRWEPEGGYKIDKALIHAFVRQESRFDPSAKSHSGAVGLMQMMPTTASYIAGRKSTYFKTSAGQRELSRPEYNLSLGQKYIAKLLSDSSINADLFKLTMAYNAGPGRLRGWDRQIDYNKDPLLFIESIPSGETRQFVERVMANYWIYRMRMDQDTPSLDAIASEQIASYMPQDFTERLDVASDDHFFFN